MMMRMSDRPVPKASFSSVIEVFMEAPSVTAPLEIRLTVSKQKKFSLWVTTNNLCVVLFLDCFFVTYLCAYVKFYRPRIFRGEIMYDDLFL